MYFFLLNNSFLFSLVSKLIYIFLIALTEKNSWLKDYVFFVIVTILVYEYL